MAHRVVNMVVVEMSSESSSGCPKSCHQVVSMVIIGLSIKEPSGLNSQTLQTGMVKYTHFFNQETTMPFV